MYRNYQMAMGYHGDSPVLISRQPQELEEINADS